MESNKKEKSESEVKNVFEQMCKQVSDYLTNNYNPHTTVIITSERIQVVEDVESIPIKRWE